MYGDGMEGKCEEKKRVCVVEQKFGNSLIFSPLSIYTTYLCELGCLECLPFSYACHTTFCNVHTCYCYYVFSRCDHKIYFLTKPLDAKEFCLNFLTLI